MLMGINIFGRMAWRHIYKWKEERRGVGGGWGESVELLKEQYEIMRIVANKKTFLISEHKVR